MILSNKTKFKFDSNYITPGSEFLGKCSSALKAYIKSRINKDPLWKNLNVIFSDASVPGEGEHKILDFIRTQRNSNKYDSNTSHCIYGADADLIMLSLIMHEPNFFIIRESLNENYYLVCEQCGKHGHTSKECKSSKIKFNKAEATGEQISQYNKERINEIEFSLIKIGVLRDYLENEFKDLIKNYEFERIIDDFVFLCFLVGNDFLPNLPSLKIREGGIDALTLIYKNILPKMDEYLTNGKGQLNLQQCEILFKDLSQIEGEFFKKGIEKKIQEDKKKKSLSKFQKNNILSIFRNIKNYKDYNKNKRGKILFDQNKFNELLKEAISEENNKKIDEYKDDIKLGTKGWKDRYYMEKFHLSFKNDKIEKEIKELKEKIKKYYIEGLRWVFEYYYNGCISWSWFYPFHYAPFASDLTNIKDIKLNFELSQPFLPFEQLLSVLPPYSAGALPPCFQKLMKDPLSPIADFYPRNIKLDINNQPYAWMGVNLLPFIDAERIHKIVEVVMNKNKDKLNKNSLKLNGRGDNILISDNSKNIHTLEGELIALKNIIEKDYDMKGINIDKLKEDKSNNFIFKQNNTIRHHNSQLLKGVKQEKNLIFENNYDYYKKNKFKGREAIEIISSILGYKDESIERYIMKEAFDNNGNIKGDWNMEPKKLDSWKKKRNNERFRSRASLNYKNRDTNISTTYKNRNRRSNEDKSTSYKYKNRSRSRYNDSDSRNYSKNNLSNRNTRQKQNRFNKNDNKSNRNNNSRNRFHKINYYDYEDKKESRYNKRNEYIYNLENERTKRKYNK